MCVVYVENDLPYEATCLMKLVPRWQVTGLHTGFTVYVYFVRATVSGKTYLQGKKLTKSLLIRQVHFGKSDLFSKSYIIHQICTSMFSLNIFPMINSLRFYSSKLGSTHLSKFCPIWYSEICFQEKILANSALSKVFAIFEIIFTTRNKLKLSGSKNVCYL